MRVSDEGLHNLSYELSARASQRAWGAWQIMFAELLALRKVADAAAALVEVAAPPKLLDELRPTRRRRTASSHARNASRLRRWRS